jgi:hypothetical protein
MNLFKAPSRNHAGIEQKTKDNKINKLKFSMGGVEARIGRNPG